MIRDLLKFALPLALQFITIALGGIFLQTVINEQGSVFIAGYTATNKMYGLMESRSIALGLACSTFFAQNYGACLYKRVRQGMRSACLIATGMAVVMMAFLFLIRFHLLRGV